MKSSVEDPYGVLGVAHDASQQEIKSAWRARMREVHPDVGGDPEDAIEVQNAYELLSDPARRRAFDDAFGRRPEEPPGQDTGSGAGGGAWSDDDRWADLNRTYDRHARTRSGGYRCTRCAANRLVESDRCWVHSTDAERDASTAAASPFCCSVTKRNRGCFNFATGLCGVHEKRPAADGRTSGPPPGSGRSNAGPGSRTGNSSAPPPGADDEDPPDVQHSRCLAVGCTRNRLPGTFYCMAHESLQEGSSGHRESRRARRKRRRASESSAGAGSTHNKSRGTSRGTGNDGKTSGTDKGAAKVHPEVVDDPDGSGDDKADEGGVLVGCGILLVLAAIVVAVLWWAVSAVGDWLKDDPVLLEVGAPAALEIDSVACYQSSTLKVSYGYDLPKENFVVQAVLPKDSVNGKDRSTYLYVEVDGLSRNLGREGSFDADYAFLAATGADVSTQQDGVPEVAAGDAGTDEDQGITLLTGFRNDLSPGRSVPVSASYSSATRTLVVSAPFAAIRRSTRKGIEVRAKVFERKGDDELGDPTECTR